MSVPDDDAALAAADVHVDAARGDMSSLRISQQTADQVREVRDSINAAVGSKIVTNEDIVRLSLLSLGRFGEMTPDDDAGLSQDEADIIMPLIDHITDATDPDVLQRHMSNSDDDGGSTE
jgi:hypothetical protein